MTPALSSEMTAAERRFYWSATARGIDADSIAKLINWQRSGAVNLDNFLGDGNWLLRLWRKLRRAK